MAGPIGVINPTRVEANLRVTGYDKKIQMKEIAHDIYTPLTGLYNTEKKTIPLDKIIAKVDSKFNTANNVRLPLKEHLSQGGTYGETNLVGREENMSTKSAIIYRDNFRHAVTNHGYGSRKLDHDWYGLIEQHINDLGPYAQAQLGLEVRQAILERFGETLVQGDTAAVRNWNRHIYVAGLGINSAVPAYNANTATYTTNILARIAASGGGSTKVPHVNQTLTIPNLSNASNWCFEERIKPLKLPVPGGEGYVLTVSERQATYMGDDKWTNRNLGSTYITLNKLSEKVQNWRGVLGFFKNFLIVVDKRQPVIDITGTSYPFGLSAQYVWPTDQDERNRSQDTVIDTAFILGNGALINYYPEPIHNVKQLDDYGKIVGTGLALVRGVQQPFYLDANDANPDQFTSGVIFCRLPDYV